MVATVWDGPRTTALCFTFFCHSMASVDIRAQQALQLLQNGDSVNIVKITMGLDDAAWRPVAEAVYVLVLDEARRQRAVDESRGHKGVTSRAQLTDIVILRELLADHAILMLPEATSSDVQLLQQAAQHLPASAGAILQAVGVKTMEPQFRAQQKKGRFEKLPPFQEFTKLLDAATLSYYRQNYISAYFNLVPIIEGILLRWMGYPGLSKKPGFKELQSFFKHSGRRQPNPHNPLFHEIFSKGCDKVLTEHLYLDTTAGTAYDNFNRHLALHLLDTAEFATQENCIRLFLLIDTMTYIYVYESRQNDDRFYLRAEDIAADTQQYLAALEQGAALGTPEKSLLVTPAP